jgi:hypothetical protein
MFLCTKVMFFDIKYATEVLLLAGLIITKIENPLGRRKKQGKTNEG